MSVARIAVVTDSAADLPADLRDRFGITVVPFNIHFGNQVLRDQLDLTTDQFLARLREADDLPRTSEPSVDLFARTFRDLAAGHDAIVAVLISSKLSGTVESAMRARDNVSDLVPIEIVDSEHVSLTLGFQAMRAAELVRAGCDAAEIARRLRAETTSYQLVFFVDTLDYLHREGRIGRAADLVSTLLKLKPVLRTDEGQLVPHDRARTRARAIEGLKEFATALPHVERLAVLHAASPGEADRLAADLAVALPDATSMVASFGPLVSAHTGPGALGIAIYEGDMT